MDGKEIRLLFDRQTDVLKVMDNEGQEIPHMVAYWFVWKGIHPESGLYR